MAVSSIVCGKIQMDGEHLVMYVTTTLPFLSLSQDCTALRSAKHLSGQRPALGDVFRMLLGKGSLFLGECASFVEDLAQFRMQPVPSDCFAIVEATRLYGGADALDEVLMLREVQLAPGSVSLIVGGKSSLKPVQINLDWVLVLCVVIVEKEKGRFLRVVEAKAQEANIVVDFQRERFRCSWWLEQ